MFTLLKNIKRYCTPARPAPRSIVVVRECVSCGGFGDYVEKDIIVRCRACSGHGVRTEVVRK